MPESNSHDKQAKFQVAQQKLNDTCSEKFSLKPTEIVSRLDKQLQAVEEGAKETSDVGNERSGPSNS